MLSDGDRADVEEVEQRLRTVEGELTELVGGASLCSISRVAGSVPSAKYLEGRAAALRDVRRRIRRGPVEVEEVVEQLIAEWRAALDDVVERDFGRDWIAYRAGGVDELSELAGD